MELAKANTRITDYNLSTLSPEELVLKLYDLGIKGCKQKDSEKVSKVLNELIASLDFNYYETANTFHNVYKYALQVLGDSNFSEIENILIELRFAWDSFVTARNGTTQEQTKL